MSNERLSAVRILIFLPSGQEILYNVAIMAYVYLLINNISGKIYVGQTVKTPSIRWSEHISKSKNDSRTLLAKAIRKYGPDAFEIVTLFEGEVSLDELDNVEKFYISALLSHDLSIGYNLTLGGRRGAMGEEFSARVSAGKLRAGTKRPDATARLLARSREEILRQASMGGNSIRGIPKKGDGGRKGSPKHARAGHYLATDPCGKLHEIRNLSEFCRVHGLRVTTMIQIASPNSKVKSHRGGWTCCKITDK